MQLGWIDFSKEDRQKAFDVINLLSEQGAVDELGIGVIRDAFANYFFPGTSTIQTRAKYFLIVPYMLREAVDGRYGKDANRVLRAIDSAEKDCGIRLLEADPKAEGVIGSRVLPKGWVARKPSDIYWNGIRTFGIFCDYGLSIPEYVSLAVKLKEQKSVSRLGNRNDDAEENDKDDSDAGDIGNIRFWNLPIYHDDWRDNLTIELTQEEAFYLDKQIQKSTKGSLAMDSSKNVRQKKKTQPICDFLDYLVMNVHNTSNNAGKKRNLIRGLCADIKDVSFSLDSKIFGEDFEVLPLGIGKNAWKTGTSDKESG